MTSNVNHHSRTNEQDKRIKACYSSYNRNYPGEIIIHFNFIKVHVVHLMVRCHSTDFFFCWYKAQARTLHFQFTGHFRVCQACQQVVCSEFTHDTTCGVGSASDVREDHCKTE